MDMTALNRSSIILAAIVNAFIMIFFCEDVTCQQYFSPSRLSKKELWSEKIKLYNCHNEVTNNDCNVKLTLVKVCH